MKIIPTWPGASLPRFHQTALQDYSSEVGIIFILAPSHVLRTLLRFSLGNSVGVFSFDLTYVQLDYYRVARVFPFFFKEFFSPVISL